MTNDNSDLPPVVADEDDAPLADTIDEPEMADDTQDIVDARPNP